MLLLASDRDLQLGAGFSRGQNLYNAKASVGKIPTAVGHVARRIIE
jgi:hypothetical protein